MRWIRRRRVRSESRAGRQGDSGIDYVEHGPGWGREQAADYVSHRYHKPSDEFDPDWDLSGAAEDLDLMFAVGRELAMETRFPQWREGNEFRAAREASRAGEGP